MDNTPTPEVSGTDNLDLEALSGGPSRSENSMAEPLNSKALFLLKIKEERRISQSNVDCLIGDFTVLLKEELMSLKGDIISCVKEGQDVDDSVSRIDNLFSKKLATSPFDGLDTAHLQRKYFLEHFHLVVST